MSIRCQAQGKLSSFREVQETQNIIQPSLAAKGHLNEAKPYQVAETPLEDSGSGEYHPTHIAQKYSQEEVESPSIQVRSS